MRSKGAILMKFEVYVRTNKIGSKSSTVVDVDDEDLEGLTDEERTRWLDNVLIESLWELIDWGWKEADVN